MPDLEEDNVGVSDMQRGDGVADVDATPCSKWAFALFRNASATNSMVDGVAFRITNITIKATTEGRHFEIDATSGCLISDLIATVSHYDSL